MEAVADSNGHARARPGQLRQTVANCRDNAYSPAPSWAACAAREWRPRVVGFTINRKSLGVVPVNEVNSKSNSSDDTNVDVAQSLAVGRVSFLGIDLLCGPGALVPRPETELLARTAVDTLQQATGGGRVIDMCCGAGNLACAIAMLVPTARVWASDLTDDCVAWASRNVDHLRLNDRVTTAQGDLFGGLAGRGLEGTIDLIVCNPPYISTSRLAADRASLLAHEPREAFDGGPYGLTIHQKVVSAAPQFLRPGGWLTFEFGLGQERQIRMVLERGKRFGEIAFVNNDAGEPRVAVARFSN